MTLRLLPTYGPLAMILLGAGCAGTVPLEPLPLESEDLRTELTALADEDVHDQEHPPVAPHGVFLIWERERTDPDWEYSGREATQLTAHLYNLNEVAQRIELRTLVDHGLTGSERESEPMHFTLGPNEHTSVEIGVTPVDDLEFSGRTQLLLQACTVGTPHRCLPAYSSPVFFHSVDGVPHAYSESVMRRRYRNGDFAGRDPESLEPGTLRVTGGPVLMDASAFDEEAVPTEPSVPAAGREPIETHIPFPGSETRQ